MSVLPAGKRPSFVLSLGLRALSSLALALSLAFLVAPALVVAHDFGGTTVSEQDDDGGDERKCPKGTCCRGGGAGGGGGGSSGAGGGGGSSPGDFTNGSVGDPIWVYDGSMSLQAVDLVVGSAFPIQLARRYDSKSAYDNALGYGWAFDHDRRLFEYPDGSVILRVGCGRRDRFPFTGGTFVTPTDGIQGELIQLGNGNYVFTRSDASRDYFDADGRLTSIMNPRGQTHELIYDARGSLPLVGTSKRSVDPNRAMVVAYQPRVARIQERSVDGQLTGAAIDFSFDDSTGRLTHVVASDGRRLDYDHDVVHGNLISVSGLVDYSQTFTYQNPSHPHAMTGWTDGLGATPVVNTLDTMGRVTKQVIGPEQIDIAYLTATTRRVTWTIKGVDGQTLHARVHNYQYQGTDLIKETNALGHELRQFYDLNRDMTRREVWQKPTTGALAILTSTDYTYDGLGRTLTAATTLDTGETITTSRTYDHGWVESEQTVSTLSPQVFRTEYTFSRDSFGVPTNIYQHKRRNDDGSFSTTSYSYCSSADITDPQASCPFVGLLKQMDGPRLDVVDVTDFSYFTSTDVSGCGSPTGTCHRIGELKSSTNAEKHTTETLAYDAYGLPARVRDANGNETRTTYHVRGWALAQTVFGTDNFSSFDDATTVWTYDARGNVTSSTDPDGVVVISVLDGRNRVVEIQNPSGARISRSLDSEGKLLREETLDDASSVRRRREFVYDKQGRRIAEIDALGRTTAFEYDALNRQTATTDALLRRTQTTYDDLSRVIRTVADAAIGGLQVQAQFFYDAAGNLRRVTDPKGLHTDYTYNALGHLTLLNSPDTGVTDYFYDVAGNRTRQIDARGVVSDFEYDAIGRMMSSKQSLNGEARDIDFSFDEPDGKSGCVSSAPIGRLVRITDASGETVYCYDTRGNTTRKSQSVTGSLSVNYRYSLADRLNRVTYPSGTFADYAFDSNGDESGLSINGLPFASIEHLAFGPISAITFTGGASQAFEYDQNYWIDNVSGTAMTLDLETDPVGNIIGLADIDPAGERDYAYDALDRLTEVNDGTAQLVEGFSYDGTGNRLSKATKSGSEAYGYPVGSHRLTTVGSTARTYDAVGSLIDRGDGWTFEYDARQRMKRAIKNGIPQLQNAYNGKGERVAKGNGLGGPLASGIVFLYDESARLLGEFDSTFGSSLREYVWLGGRPIAVLPKVGAFSSELLAIHSDHLGTPRAVTRPTGSHTTIWRWELAGGAFGDDAPDEDPDGDESVFALNLRYPGQYFDSETGLFYNYFRDYETGTGRYAESDPIGLAGGLSTFGYVFGNPLGWTDEFGLASVMGCANPANAAICAAAGIGPTAASSSGASSGAVAASAAATAGALTVPGDSTNSRSKVIPKPKVKRGNWTCTCRADCDDRIPGNCPDDPNLRFAFGTASSASYPTAKKEAKRLATAALACQPKHIPCTCTSPSGETSYAQ